MLRSLSEASSTEQEDMMDREINEIVLKSDSICKLCNSLLFSSPGNNRIPIANHKVILNALTRRLQSDDPPYVSFEGTKESLLQLSALTLCCPKAYTVALWINIDPDAQSKGFLLFRCRCSTGGIDAMVTDRQGSSKWLITLRSHTGNYNASTEKDETRNLHINLVPKQWHLLCIHHAAPASILGVAKLSVSIDGVDILTDPNSESNENRESCCALLYPFQSQSESNWKLAVGFKGKIASFGMYCEFLNASQVQLMYNLGPHVPNYSFGVNFPQSTFDSGHAQLGSIYARMVPLRPEFSWSIDHFLENACLSYTSVGNLNAEHIDMSSAQSEKLLIPYVVGNTQIVNGISCIEPWNAAGGVYFCLYLLWDHCLNFGISANNELQPASREQLSGEMHEKYDVVAALLELLASMIKVSCDFKEQFIQLHGFHIVAHCLDQIAFPARQLCADWGLVDECINLTRSLGVDALRGDGIASALQGLLFDFRVWKDCSLVTKQSLLEAVVELGPSCADQLFRSIGVQTILDILRFHIFAKPFDETADSSRLSSCADAGFALVQLSMDAAFQFAKDSKSKLIAESEVLLACLDECASSIVTERVLKTLQSLRISNPSSLLRALNDARFAETTGIALLSKKGYSMIVRRETLILFLWSIDEGIRQVSSSSSSSVDVRNAQPSASKRTVQATKSQQPMSSQGEGNPIAIQRHSKTSLKPFEKNWLTLSMLADSIDMAIQDGSWEGMNMYEEVVCILAHDGPLGIANSWILLPLLCPFLDKFRCSLALCQRVLMSINVALKMDDLQSEVLGSLADRLWCKHFVSLACIGESYSKHNASLNLGTEIADTCTELALDALSTVLEHKTRYQGYSSSGTWSVVQECLKFGCARFGTSVEMRFLKRCVSLVFQRLARSSERWSANKISSVVNILALIDTRKLCGHAAPIVQSGNNSGQPPIVPHTLDEQQILFFMMDIMTSLRKASGGGSLEGIERRALRPANRIVLGCLRIADDNSADRICVEIMSMLQHMSEPWGAPNQKSFDEFVVLIFSQLRQAIADNLLDENIRGRYSALVYHIMHHFIGLRYNVASRGSVSVHVIPMLDALTGIDTEKDVNNIFQMLEIRLKIAKVGTKSIASAPDWQHPMAEMEGSSLEKALLGTKHVDSALLPDHPEESDVTFPNILLESNDELPSAHGGLRPASSEQHAKWLQVRWGIVADRVESERARMFRVTKSLQVSADSSARYWEKLYRKIKTEYCSEDLVCEWKLGVSHEGPFPGRKRVVLRPRYKKTTSLNPQAQISINRSKSMDVLVMGRELSKVYRSSSVENGAKDGDGGDCSAIEQCSDVHPHDDGSVDTAWRLVDADGSEEGFGVVGISHQENSTHQSSESSASSDGDLLIDVKQTDEKFYHGRGVETGPALPGTRKYSSLSTKAIIEARVMLVTASGNTWGSLSLNSKELCFASVAEPGRREESNDSASVNLASVPRMRRRRWALSTVSAVYLRRYRLRNSALEVFFRRGKHRNFFVDFGHTEEDENSKNDFARALMSAAPKSAFLHWPTVSQFSLVGLHGVQARWLNGEISNFDYLMALNTISGRSFNDLCQYPVMPWVIAQYTNSILDLNDAKSYRDLSKPMGALNEARLKEFLDRYESFEENGAGEMPPFMYGSHYSTMVGVVLHFLMRIQPFADLHREMQGGHFDVADRLFSSVPRTWLQNTTQLSEVKEVTPEWFTTPEIFKNVNGFDLGKTQDGEVIGDVEMPPWASSPEEFVRLNREALESDFVSESLHEWIDLIFGYKQLLPHSEKAHNVFFYLTYSNLVDWKTLSKDEVMRAATELQISHFGQTPMQIFNTAHPKKGPRLFSKFIPRPLKKCFPASESNIHRPRLTSPANIDEIVSMEAKAALLRMSSSPGSPVLAISIQNSWIVFVLECGNIEVVKFGVSDHVKNAIAAANTKMQQQQRRGSQEVDREDAATDHIMGSIPEPIYALQRDLPRTADLLTRLPTAANLPTARLANVVRVTPSGRYVLSGGKIDGSISVRELEYRCGFIKSEGDFRSHRSPVLHISADSIPNATTDVIASCDASGMILVWTVSEIRHPIGNLKDMFERESVISRRPQRMFRCKPCPEVSCDISCKMGIIVVTCCGTEVHIFSIERDERIRCFHASKSTISDTDYRKRTIRRVTLCNDGLIVVHVEESCAPLIDGFEVAVEHFVEVYGLSGSFIASACASTAITFLSCPSHGEVVITGQSDGCVNLYRSQNLDLLYSIAPHVSCILSYAGSDWTSADIHASPSPSAVVCIKVGPNPDRPTLLVISCQSGDTYLRALPDFVRWEKNRNPSALAQLVSAPLEVVRGTLHSAHQLSQQIQTNAHNIATNARSIADDAISELKKSGVGMAFSRFFTKGGER